MGKVFKYTHAEQQSKCSGRHYADEVNFATFKILQNKFPSVNLLMVILLIVVLGACKKAETYPIIPEIKLESYLRLYNSNLNVYDRGVLKISFTDGDGDIGLRQEETQPPYDYNFYISYFEIQNGDTVRVYPTITDPATGNIDTLTFDQRIPMLTPIGSIKSIEGEIEDTLQAYNFNSTFDTIMFEAYIIDRAFHKSNTVITPLIVRK